MESNTAYHKSTRLCTYQGSFRSYKHFENAKLNNMELGTSVCAKITSATVL